MKDGLKLTHVYIVRLIVDPLLHVRVKFDRLLV
jgi:hypothetical protein